MKLFQRGDPPEPKTSLRDRAHNVNLASVLLQEKRLDGTLADKEYEILHRAIVAEIDAVAQALRATRSED